MYIQVRTIDTKSKITIEVSKSMPILDLKKQLETSFNISAEKQRLFFRGKQLEDEYTLFDYGINLNDMIQIMEKVVVDTGTPVQTKDSQADSKKSLSVDQQVSSISDSVQESTSDDISAQPSSSSGIAQASSSNAGVEKSKYFQVGEFVEARDSTYGAWFEGKIAKIIEDKNKEGNKENLKEDEADGVLCDEYLYEVAFIDDGEVVSSLTCKLDDLRPRAQHKVPVEQLKVGQKVLANYNMEDKSQRGYWYQCIIKKIISKRGGSVVKADVFICASIPLSDCALAFTDEIFQMEEIKPLSERTPMLTDEPPARLTGVPVNCKHCNNKRQRNCKECGCNICGLKTDENKQIMCDECDYAFHIWCLKPPLEEIPSDEEWYCPDCKNDENEIVAAGSKLKRSKKKEKMASKQKTTTRDWGKGMACVARTKECTIVPSDHFGPIPGVEVGTCWKFRLQVSEAGVHRPHVAGIHGRENIGAFSVVLSGGYEDDIDNGEEVYYTGSGGRDLSGNRRTNAQGFDQTLTRFNKALALNCNVPINEKGAEAKNWRGGKPVRVVRNYKLAKHSKYAPEDGNRYDGIYKVVKYYPQKGKSGFNVWRFVFRRDDPIPPPWSKEGKKRIESLGLEMQYPEGYLEAKSLKNEMEKENEDEPSGKRGSKRVLEESSTPQAKVPEKKRKVQYELDEDVSVAIKKDTMNEKLWDECLEELVHGKSKFLTKVEDTFICICCTELVFKPITTDCHHNFCLLCLKRSFAAKVMTCPTCRASLEEDVTKSSNTNLQSALDLLFPGYSASR